MKIPASRLTFPFISAAALLCVTWFARGQSPSASPDSTKAVELKERELAEKAIKRLNSAWAQHLKSGRTQPAPQTPRIEPNLVMAPDVEKQKEAAVPAPQRQSLARTTTAEFIEADVVRSQNGELKVTLVGKHAHNHIGADPVYLRAFNGKLVGPTLRVKPGDKIRLTLKNEMPGERWRPNMMDTLNSFNTMNLHYHGLHVSPNGISDNVLNFIIKSL